MDFYVRFAVKAVNAIDVAIEQKIRKSSHPGLRIITKRAKNLKETSMAAIVVKTIPMATISAPLE